jgi:hypothetical protein
MTKKLTYSQRDTDRAIRHVCKEFGEFLVEKNHKYGNSAFEPMTVFSQASAEEKLRIRQEDKLKKIVTGSNLKDEDAEQDFVGYHFLIKALKYLEDAQKEATN